MTMKLRNGICMAGLAVMLAACSPGGDSELVAPAAGESTAPIAYIQSMPDDGGACRV